MTAFIPTARPSIGEEELESVRDVFESRWLGLGSTTAEFEERLSEFCSGRSVVATNTGTSAIQLALETIGIGPGDEVITPAMTFVATAQAILATGATPVLCDIDRESLNVTANLLDRARTSRTRAVVPVDYRGMPVDIDEIGTWASQFDIRVVVDSAHSFGSLYADGTRVGSAGDICCFSFDPIKNITAGEGGAIVFADEAEASIASQMRVLGIDSTAWSRMESRRPWEYDVTRRGYRFHMPNFNAAIGLRQLDKLEAFGRRKQAVLTAYLQASLDPDILTVWPFPVDRAIPFLALVATSRRDALMDHLRRREIGTGVNYQPMSRFTLLRDSTRTTIPNTEEVADRLVAVPLLNDQSDAEIDRVVEGLITFR